MFHLPLASKVKNRQCLNELLSEMDDFILEKIATQYCGTLGGVTGQLNHSDKGDDWPSTSNLLTLNLPLQMIVQEAPIQAWWRRH